MFEVVSGGGDLVAELLGDGCADRLPALLGVIVSRGERADGLGDSTTVSSSQVRVLGVSPVFASLTALHHNAY